MKKFIKYLLALAVVSGAAHFSAVAQETTNAVPPLRNR